MKYDRGGTLDKVVVAAAAFVVVAFVGLVFFAARSPGISRKALAQNDVTSIAVAAVTFKMEYGRLPGVGKQVVGGEMLAALRGSNSAMNPSNIMFLDLPQYYADEGRLSEGTLLDPWGGEYQISFSDGTGNLVVAGTNSVVIRKLVAVWSDPSLSDVPPWWQFWKSRNWKNQSVNTWE